MFLSAPSFATDVTAFTCGGGKLFRVTRALKIKHMPKLDIIELSLDPAVTSSYYGHHQLYKAPLATKMKERLAIYRYDAIADTVHDTFEETRIIKDVAKNKLLDLMVPNQVYTFTVQDKKISIAKSIRNNVRDYASKHLLLASEEEDGLLRMAGENWVEVKEGKKWLHISSDSGSTQPDSDDLKRTVKFYQEHLGITDIIPHYSRSQEPIVRAPGATISSVAFQVATHMNSSPGGRIQMVLRQKDFQERLRKDPFSIKDENGNLIKYEVRKVSSLVNESVEYDTKDGLLQRNNIKLQKRRSYDSSEKDSRPPLTLDPNDESVQQALRLGAAISTLVPIKKMANELIDYGVYRVGPADAKPAFVLSMKEQTSTNGTKKSAPQYSATLENLIEDKSSELSLLEKHFQNRFTAP